MTGMSRNMRKLMKEREESSQVKNLTITADLMMKGERNLASTTSSYQRPCRSPGVPCL